MAPSDLADECQRLRELGASVGRYTAEKHESYGSAYTGGGELVRLLTSGGDLKPDLFVAAILATRIFEKLKRFFTAPKAFNESPLVDVIGHALCLAMLYGAEPPEVSPDGDPLDVYRAKRLLNEALVDLDPSHTACEHMRAALACLGQQHPVEPRIDIAECVRSILEYARDSAVYSGDGRPRRSEMGAIVRMCAATLRALGQPQPDDEAFADADGTAETTPSRVDDAARVLLDALELVGDHAIGKGVGDLSEHRSLGRKLRLALLMLGRPDHDGSEPLFEEPLELDKEAFPSKFEQENLPGEALPGPAGGGEWPAPLSRRGWSLAVGRVMPCKGACVLGAGHTGFCSTKRDWGGDMLGSPAPTTAPRYTGRKRSNDEGK